MSYRFSITEPVTENLRRIASEEIDLAVAHLRGRKPETREEDIHEARKGIKRLRALVRLVRPEFGRKWKRENSALRDVGRTLSDLRDSSIVLETFDTVAQDPSDQKALTPARKGLERQKKAKETSIDADKTLQEAAGALEEIRARVPGWALKSDGFEAIAEGLRTEYRDGRKAMSKALKKNDSALFHEWRKRAKNQLFHMRLLKRFLPELLAEQEQLLHQLESALGDDHNLLILRQHLDTHPDAFGGRAIVKRSLDLVSHREEQLRREAEVLGQSTYSHKPRKFVEQIRTEWETATRSGMVRRKAKASAA